MMTKRERVHASIGRKGFDALPWQFDLTSHVWHRLERAMGSHEAVVAALDDHIVCVGHQDFASQEGMGADLRRNEFGTIWRHAPVDRQMGDWGSMAEYPLKEPTLAGYKFPDGSRPGRWAHVPALREKAKDQFIVAYGPGLWEAAWGLCGFENYLEYAAGEPGFVEELTDKLATFSCEVTKQLKGMGVDGIRYGDDWAFQERLMVAPAAWRRLLKKHYRRVFDTAHETGLVVGIHSCGKITEILPDLIEIGVDVVHPVQPEAMDVVRCQREYGRDLNFWGTLGCQSTLPNGTAEDCRREVEGRLKLFGDGGFILAPAGAAPTETPAENVLAVAAAARGQLAEARPKAAKQA